AVRVHALLAEGARATGRDAGDQDLVALLDPGHLGAHLFHDIDTLVVVDPPVRYIRYISLEDVQLGAADLGVGHVHDQLGSLRVAPQRMRARRASASGPPRAARRGSRGE